MRKITISEMTLRERAANLSFKEKLELARGLDRLKADTIELPPIHDQADALCSRTIAQIVQTAVSADAGMTEASVDAAWESIRGAKHPMLHILAPVSPVQMEYAWHKKAPAMLEAVDALIRRCRFHCEQVEFSCLDATRAEWDTLRKMIETAIAAGATRVTLCDTAGILLPEECADFVRMLRESIPQLANVEMLVQVSDEMHMAMACAAAALLKGADGIKATLTGGGYPSLEEISHFIRVKGNTLGISVGLRDTELNRMVKQLNMMLGARGSESVRGETAVSAEIAGICLSATDEIGEVVNVIHQLGYNLSDEDNARVYEAFRRVAEKKQFVGSRELDAIVASTAMQVPSAYRLDSYVINCGNIINASANVCLEREGKKERSISIGDGPIDAAFLAIEQIIGHHYELDDFQIQTVTEGRESMGSALVRLRANGRLYSGNGISTDIIGASIRAYVNALNKIVYEEA